MEKDNIIRSKTFQFSLNIIELYKQLISKQEFVISKQLLKSATSIGANIREAQAGQSKKDFLAKIYIAFKEANETSYWLELLEKSNFVGTNISSFLAEIDEILKILNKIIQTTKINIEK
ncbi:four helix bundle protein [Candidatus Gracilibacteria bacterium]|nr:four helix bundle protein [Candidatus Gracilibacteria bacterium]